MLTPSRHVNILPSPIFVFASQSIIFLQILINFNFCRKINLFDVQSHLYKKRLVATPLLSLLILQVERETVMTRWIHTESIIFGKVFGKLLTIEIGCHLERKNEFLNDYFQTELPSFSKLRENVKKKRRERKYTIFKPKTQEKRKKEEYDTLIINKVFMV